MAVKIIQPIDLHPDDFSINAGKVRVVIVRQQFDLTWGSNTQAGNGDDRPMRRTAIIQSGFGTIHLDFKRVSGTSGVIAVLPNTCPTPQSLIEVQLYDGGTVWVEGGSRQVNSYGLTVGRRYITDLVGYFNE